MVAGDLPEDVVRDIASRLAVKSVLRFNCVHSTWNSLFKSPSFVAAHLGNPENKRGTSTSTSVLLAKYVLLNGSKKSSLRLLNPHTYIVYRDVCQIPFEEEEAAAAAGDWFEVAGSCNGLVCLFDSARAQLCLYNPCLEQQYKMIPRSPLYMSMPPPLKDRQKQYLVLDQPPPPLQCSFVFGFAYDPLINDYKVVSLVSQGQRRDPPSPNNDFPFYNYDYIHSVRAEVYTLGTNCWRQVEVVPDHIQSYYYFSLDNNVQGALVGGAIHWLGRTNILPYYGAAEVILSFDVSNEIFRLIRLPAAITDGERLRDYMRVVVHGDWLCLVKFKRLDFAYPFRPCDIWVMKEYGVEESWTKLHADICLSQVAISEPADFLGIGINGELVFNDTRYKALSLLYPHDQRCNKRVSIRCNKRVSILNEIMPKCTPRLVTNFVETLVSPHPDPDLDLVN